MVTVAAGIADGYRARAVMLLCSASRLVRAEALPGRASGVERGKCHPHHLLASKALLQTSPTRLRWRSFQMFPQVTADSLGPVHAIQHHYYCCCRQHHLQACTFVYHMT